MKRFHTAAALVLLAGSSAAQYEFDVIYFDHLAVDSPAGSWVCNGPWSVVVNTGSVPIPSSAWQVEGLSFATASSTVSGFYFSEQGAFQGGALEPGQAAGSSHPLLHSLLQPGEIFAGGGDPLAFCLGPGPAGTTQTIETYFQLRDRWFAAPVQVDFGPGLGSAWAGISVRRVPAVFRPAVLAPAGVGCPFGAQSLTLLPAEIESPIATAVSAGDLPALGNPYFAVEIQESEELYPLIGKLWVAIFGVQPASLLLFGCTLHVDPSAPSIVTSGVVVEEPGFPFNDAAPVRASLAIPADPSLVGLVVRAQMGIVQPTPSQALALTDAIALTLAQAP